MNKQASKVIKLITLSIGLLALLVLLGYWVITQHVYAQEPNTVSEHLRLEEYACEAFDSASFKACIFEAKTTSMPFIKVTKPIVCLSSIDCSFEIKDHKSFLTISSSKPENKFIRQNDFSYTLLNVENSANIEFKGLTFEDVVSSGCPNAITCPPYITVKKASDIEFNNISFINSSSTSLFITDSRDLEITGSNFKNSFKTGLEIRTADFTQNLRIEKNSFEGNLGSALVFQASSVAGQSKISANKFINNHSGGAYSNCFYPCVGAQLRILPSTSNLRIDQNLISGGVNTAFDSLGLYSSGIEVAGQDISNTILFCNEISDNRGSGVVQSGPFRNISNVSLTENKIFNNGLNLNIPTVTADNNCYTAECKLTCKAGN